MSRISLTLLALCLSLSSLLAQDECVQVSRVQSGDQARITLGESNTVRVAPNIEAEALGIIAGGEIMTVLDSAVCVDQYVWIQVQHEDMIGWTVEATDVEYWIQPLTGKVYDTEQISLIVPEDLATDVTIELELAQHVLGGTLPDRLVATFDIVDDVQLSRAPRLIVAPVSAFEGMFAERAQVAITRLTALEAVDFVLEDLMPESVTANLATQNSHIPNDPFIFAARRLLVALPHRVQMTNGYGVAFITMYGQDIYPVNNGAVFYNFVGITNDEQYWVSFQYPVTTEMLVGQEDIVENIPNWRDTYDVYMQQATESLNTLTPEDWQPSLNDLDALVGSIFIRID